MVISTVRRRFYGEGPGFNLLTGYCKLLAFARSRKIMNHPACPALPAARRFVAGLLLAHVAAIVILTVSPRLHHWIHPDADDDDHDCAVELFLHGGCHAAPGMVHAPLPPCEYHPVAFVAATPSWVASIFSLGSILEHAPPAAD